LRSRLKQELEHATSTLQASADIDASLVEGDAAELLAGASADWICWWSALVDTGPLRAVLLGSVSTALVRSARSPLVVVPRGATAESVL
jgi:nucleotide-binding universal stress UspA family protein